MIERGDKIRFRHIVPTHVLTLIVEKVYDDAVVGWCQEADNNMVVYRQNIVDEESKTSPQRHSWRVDAL